MAEQATISIDQILEPQNKMREVDSQGEQFQELVASVKEKGVLEPIQVVRNDDGFFEIVNGNHRFHAATEAEHSEIPCNIITADEHEKAIIMLITNAVRIETKPAEYARQLALVLKQDPHMTASKLARKVFKSQAWIQNRLKLTKLDETVANMVDEDRITVANAIKISELPADVQSEFSDDASVMTNEDFSKTVDERLAQLEAAKKTGNASAEAVFVMKTKRLTVKDIQAMIDDPDMLAAHLSDVGYGDNLSSVESAFIAGLKYSIGLDPISEATARNEFDDRQNNSEDKKRLKKMEALKKAKAKEDKRNLHRGEIVQIRLAGYDAKKPEEEIEAEVKAYQEANDCVPPVKKPKVEKADG